MGIGPIPGIGAVEPVKLRERESVMPLDEALEAQARLEEDSYAGSGGEPDRGMESGEQECAEEPAAETDKEISQREGKENGDHWVSFFA